MTIFKTTSQGFIDEETEEKTYPLGHKNYE